MCVCACLWPQIEVSPHATCELQLAVLNSTSSASGGHKFKLSRLFVTGAVVDAAAASGGKAGPGRGAKAEVGTLPLKGMKAKHCRGPLCQPTGGGKRRGGRGGGGMTRFVSATPEDAVPGRTQAPALAQAAVTFGDDVDDSILAARNAALSLLRAARNERSGQVREGSLRLLLQPSLLPAPAVTAAA